MKNRRFISLILAILLSVTVFAAAAESGNQERVSEIKVAIHNDENTLTPFTVVRGYPGVAVMRLIFDSLFFHDEKNQPQPWMVDEYEVNAEYTEYKMRLTPGQFWHDGEPVTANDVAFSFTYSQTQNNTLWQRIANLVESVDVADELNFTIRLKVGNPDFLAQSLTCILIIPKHIYENVEDASTVRETVGSGPYKLVEYTEGQHYIFEAVDGYFRGDARVARIVMPIITDTTTIFQALKAGSIHATTANLAPELVSGFAAERDITVVTGSGLATTLLQINNEVYPFTLTEMRKALALAVDTEELVDVLLLGLGDRGSLGFFHPAGMFGKEGLVVERDVAKANELLDGLGFVWQGDFRVDDNGQPLRFELLTRADDPLRIRTAELIAEQVKDVGIELKVLALEANTLDMLVWPEFDVTKGRNYDLSIWGWSAPVQLRSDALIQLAASEHAQGTFNIGGFASSAFDILTNRYLIEMNLDTRRAMIDEMQELVAAEVPMIPLYYPQVIMAYWADAYDGWVLQQGSGIINKMSFLPGFSQESGVQEPQVTGRNMMPFYLLGLVLVAGVVVAKWRKRRGHAS
ncbi:MAG: Oligopeptide-binding protein AppA [Syntrophomonadaceae bacterium]|nr:Oligopeptide-binding protein AppA [Bacillota bacterium]